MRKILLTALILILNSQFGSAQGYIPNREPLVSTDYMEIPLGSIKARGWLKEQLERQASGLTGHLDEIYPRVVGPDNAWIGGEGDCWERGPYWIDGLLPLAYILDKKDLKEKARIWVEAILNSQKPDGYFGPDTDRPYKDGMQRDNAHDWWPKMVALKILKQYYMATGDDRVVPFMTKYFRYQLEKLPQYPLNHWTGWAAKRGGDNLQIVYWLYNITGDAFLLELGELIHKQTTPWTDIFLGGNQLYKENSIHCVNLAQGFKEPVVYYQQAKNKKYVEACETALKTIRTTIGFPTGLWAGDEMIHFGDPTRGSELCTAVEMMYSLEDMIRITGYTKWADLLERIAFNALPAQTDDDYTCRQYFQQINQIKATREYRNFETPHGGTDQVFGTLNGYPCCTCNMHQGWPKFTQSLWMATSDEGIAAMVYSPSEVTATVGGGKTVKIIEDTFYPFDETVKFTFKLKGKANFPIRLRIPEWCKDAKIRINGKALESHYESGTVVVLRRDWANGDELALELPMRVERTKWYDSASVIERGPLVYALKMKENRVKKEFPQDQQIWYGKWYYEVTSDSQWNYALISDNLRPSKIESNFTVVKSDKRPAYPWNVENAPLTIKTKAVIVDEWTEHNGSAGPIGYKSGPSSGREIAIELIPYGCTTLRITEFPER